MRSALHLSAETYGNTKRVGRVGFEPTARGLKVHFFDQTKIPARQRGVVCFSVMREEYLTIMLETLCPWRDSNSRPAR